MRRLLEKFNDADWLISGSMASMASAATLMLCGWVENRRPAGPMNGPSQWLFGTEAAERTRFSPGHTLPGYAIHHASSLLWSGMHHALHAPYRSDVPLGRRMLQGMGTAAVAAFVDYGVAKGRWQPGFDKQLSRTSLLAVYLTFGAALALTTHVLAQRRTQADALHDPASSR